MGFIGLGGGETVGVTKYLGTDRALLPSWLVTLGVIMADKGGGIIEVSLMRLDPINGFFISEKIFCKLGLSISSKLMLLLLLVILSKFSLGRVLLTSLSLAEAAAESLLDMGGPIDVGLRGNGW
jgi:hypothetical protein